MRVLLLRPEPGAGRSARALAKLGHEPVLAPLFTISAADMPRPDGDFDALIITSAHAARPLWNALPARLRALPLLAVGPRSASAARGAGFTDIHAAGGSGRALIRDATERLMPGARLLLALGQDHKDDFAPRLAAEGFLPETWIVYRAQAVNRLPDPAARALAQGGIDAILHYSRRGAETFLALARQDGCWDKAAALPHLALSSDVAEPLRAAGADAIHVAPEPLETTLLQLLPGISARHSVAVGGNLPSGSGALTGVRTQNDSGDSMSSGTKNGEKQSPSRQMPGSGGKSGRESRIIEGDVVAHRIIGGPEPDAATPDADAAPAPSRPTPAPQAEPKTGPGTGQAGEAAPIPAPVRSFGLGALVGAGLLGGLAGGGLVLAVGVFGGTGSDSAARDAAIDARLAKFQPALAPREALGAIESRLGAVDSRLGSFDSRLGAVSAEVAETARRFAEWQAARPAAAGGSEAEAARITRQIDDTSSKIAGLAERLTGVEMTAKAPGTPSMAAIGAAELVLVGRIIDALREGRPFTAEIEALAARHSAAAPGGGESIAALRAVAAQGAVSGPALRSAFRNLRPALERDGPAQAQSLADRALGVLQGLVSIRNLGETAGTDRAALLARVDAGLAAGDVAGAFAAWRQLPEPLRGAGADFGGKLQMHAVALAGARQLEREALAMVGAGK